MKKIFISYKRLDLVKVKPIKDKIESIISVPCWMDLEGIHSEDEFNATIVSAINDCEIFLFMYSMRHSQIKDYKNDYTLRELKFAHKKGKKIIIINIDNQRLSDYFEFMYDGVQVVDTTPGSINKLLDDLRTWF